MLESVFEYGYTDSKEKFAKFKACYANNSEIIIKMTDGNTNGTTRRLKKFHYEEYKEAFPDSVNKSPNKVVI